MDFDMLLQTASSVIEVFKFWVMMLKFATVDCSGILIQVFLKIKQLQHFSIINQPMLKIFLT